jgi:single-stranded DNA-binding protein
VTGWNEQASYMERSFVTGSKVLVEGRISYRGYTNKAGVWITLTDIRAVSIMNLDR